MVSHEDMLFEHEIYHKLVQIRVFRQFRLWKTFYVWRRTVKRDKYERTVRFYALYCIVFFACCKPCDWVAFLCFMVCSLSTTIHDYLY